MITILLEKIITILEGWIQSFTSHTQHVEDKLDSLDQTASDIKTNTEPISDIADNTGAVVTPIQNIKSNTDSIATSSQTSANNTTAILNNISTLSTNTGRAAAYAQDCANNTLDIRDKITTIASDTTQIRADNANIAADVSSINQAIGYYVANTPVTEDSEGVICNIDTDLEDYLQKLKVNIPADPTGYTGITITKCGKNLLENQITTRTLNGTTVTLNPDKSITVLGTPSSQSRFSMFSGDFIVKLPCKFTCGTIPNGIRFFAMRNSSGTITYPSLTNGYNLPTIGDKFSSFYLEVNPAYDGSPVTFYPMISAIDNDTVYEPYKAMTYPVSFGSTITDGAEADLLSGLVKVNTTPESFIQIQPIAVRTYKGVNNIYSDIGTSALTYRETLKHYLDKHNQ